MKKIFALLITLSLALTLFVGCSSNNNESTASASDAETSTDAAEADSGEDASSELETITVGASMSLHGKILEAAREVLNKKGYNLEIIQYTDYIQPNLALENGELDANYVQNQACLNEYNEQYSAKLVSVAGVHYEPFGLYAGKLSSLDEITEGSSIAIPNDADGEARALLMLEDVGYIKLKDDVGLSATVLDIEENSLNLDIMEMEASQIASAKEDADFVILSASYAVQAGLNIINDALATEDENSQAYEPCTNVIAVQDGNENEPIIEALVEALTSEEVRKFIEEEYEGSAVAVF